MHHEEFYPTPPEVADKMVAKAEEIASKYKRSGRTGCLDPSAGKGDLLKAVKRYRRSLSERERASAESLVYRYGNLRGGDYSSVRNQLQERKDQLANGAKGLGSYALNAFEIVHDLREILKADGVSIHGHDFLKGRFLPPVHYVVMNPPFSNGVDHLLHAWNTVDATAFVCLLNATNYHNAYSQGRKELVRLVEEFGEVEDLGSVFMDAERTTAVEVVMITLIKPERNDDVLNFGSNFKKVDLSIDLEDESSSLVVADKIARIEAYFDQYIEAIKTLQRAFGQLHGIADALGFKRDVPTLSTTVEAEYTMRKAELWDDLLSSTDFRSLMSAKVYEQFMRKFATQREAHFCRENVDELLRVLTANAESIYLDSLVDVFDKIARGATKNVEELKQVDGNATGAKFGQNGWKTNDAFMNFEGAPHILKPKFVYPFGVKETWMNGKYQPDGPDMQHWRLQHLLDPTDLDNVLARLAGVNISSVKTVMRAYRECRERGDGNKFQSTFFNCIWYKKGTVHFTFRDKQLYYWFMCKAAEHKGYPLKEAEKVYENRPNIKQYLMLK